MINITYYLCINDSLNNFQFRDNNGVAEYRKSGADTWHPFSNLTIKQARLASSLNQYIFVETGFRPNYIIAVIHNSDEHTIQFVYDVNAGQAEYWNNYSVSTVDKTTCDLWCPILDNGFNFSTFMYAIANQNAHFYIL